ncbi:MAG: TonB-dependent receptor plug domain-containing protein [Gemmatimonadaceae bacterium]
MRTLVVIAAAIMLSACSGERLTGPAAQEAVRQHQASMDVTDDMPLVLLDGRAIRMAEARSLDPSTIGSVEVVKGAAAASRYGDRATRGVILITSKSASQ